MGEFAVYKDNFLSRILWLTRSNAFFRSRKIAPTTSELLMAESQLSHSLANAVWHECWERKSDCDWHNRLCSARKFSKCLCICLSIGFESRGSMGMGRKLFGSLKSLVLGKGITFAFFRIVGKTLLRIDKCYIYRWEAQLYMWELVLREMDSYHHVPWTYCYPS